MLSLALLALPLVAARLTPYPAPTIPAREKDTLIAFHAAAGGFLWTDAQNWADDRWDPCLWFGVTCTMFSDGPHVTMIELPYNSLSGSLPDTLGWLDHLTRLDVHGNELRTSRVCPLSCVRMQKCNVMSHPLLLQPTLSAVTKPTMVQDADVFRFV